jgi:hypothetical protein
MFELFTQNNKQVLYLPDPITKRGDPRRRQTCRIHNAMDESEVAKIEKHHSQCDNYDHIYKKCPINEQPAAAEAGPSGNPHDGRPPQDKWATRS